MKQTFHTQKLYYGFPIYFIGYKDATYGYNITTSSSSYSLGDTLVMGMATKSNAVEQIKRYGEFSINIPTKESMLEIEQAGFNSRRDKLDITNLSYTLAETIDAPLIDQCEVSIECQVVESYELEGYTTFVTRITRRVVEERLIENNRFNSQLFEPVCYMGDGKQRVYRHFNEQVNVLGQYLKEHRKQNRKQRGSE